MKKKINIDGKIINNYQESALGIFIKKSEYLNTKPVTGLHTYAHYCDSKKDDKKWKVEWRKDIARKFEKPCFIEYYKTRKEAETRIFKIENILS